MSVNFAPSVRFARSPLRFPHSSTSLSAVKRGRVRTVGLCNDRPQTPGRKLLEDFAAALRAKDIDVDALGPGLTGAQIDGLVRLSGLQLPNEVRAWWRWHNTSRVELLPAWGMLTREKRFNISVQCRNDGDVLGSLLELQGLDGATAAGPAIVR